jgi:hypothetical protein
MILVNFAKSLIMLLLEIVLLIVGSTVFLILSIVGILYTFIKHALVKYDYSLSKQVTPLIRALNLLKDCFANAAAGELLNDALKIKGRIRYGKWYQSISATTGLIKIFNNEDTWLRRFLDKVFFGPHCEDAIRDEDRFYWTHHINEPDI